MVPIKRIPIKLDLGKDYFIWWGWNSKLRRRVLYRCRLIQPTAKGFNFLNLETSKCMLPVHLYPSKHPNHIKDNNTWFWVNSRMGIEEI
jgi:hypothetical protein